MLYRLPMVLLTVFILVGLPVYSADEPTAQSLIERHEKEKSPVWLDGETATFFHRGEAEQVTLFIGGEEIAFRRLPHSDVWTATFTRPGITKGVFTYAILVGNKQQMLRGKRLVFQAWRGPQAPPAAAKVKDLKGEVKTVAVDSQALGGKRKVRVYLPPGYDRTKSYPVIYGTDGNDGATVLEPLITAGKVPPLIVVAAFSGDYQGDRSAGYDPKKDLRLMEYLTGEDAERYAKHETFFCTELPAWAEREFGASPHRKDRAVFGCSNGARFAVDMGVKHPDLFGHVFAFSVAGHRSFQLPEPAAGLPHFHLAAGTWETFHTTTKNVAEELQKHHVSVTFVTRVAGHDPTMWEDELAAAAVRAFGKGIPSSSPADGTEDLKTAAKNVVERLANGEFDAVVATFDQALRR